uniref:Uncharacterized protein n=1 Tax=Rhizophora mucronata TaxID=61149 RepID=A0A2P2PJJ9_RHIMU
MYLHRNSWRSCTLEPLFTILISISIELKKSKETPKTRTIKNGNPGTGGSKEKLLSRKPSKPPKKACSFPSHS